MSAAFNNKPQQEMLKAENDFLKMKLMLENGADFINMDQVDAIPPEIENQFLNYVASFERQLKNPKYITVFEKFSNPISSGRLLRFRRRKLPKPGGN